MSATGECQGCQRSHRDDHTTDDLHGLSLLKCFCIPQSGDATPLSGDPQEGDKPLHQPTSYGLSISCFMIELDEAMMGPWQGREAPPAFESSNCLSLCPRSC